MGDIPPCPNKTGGFLKLPMMFTLKSPFDSFISTTKGVLFSPTSFFRSVYWDSINLVDALVYAFVCGTASTLIRQFLLPSSYSLLPIGYLTKFTSIFPLPGLQTLPSFLLLSLFSLIYLFFGGTIFFLIAKVLFQGRASYSAVLSAMAAVYAIQLLNWIPIINAFIGIYALILMVIAIREVEQFTTGKAIATLLLPFILTSLISVYFIFKSLYQLQITPGHLPPIPLPPR